MLINELHAAELNSSIQTIRARVEIHKDSTLEKICDCGRDLSDFTIERVGENKFFGFGICQKLKVNFLDESAALGLTKEHFLEATFGVGTDFLYVFPKFYVEEVLRDEETNDITVTAYDGLYKAANHTVSELILPDSYTIKTFALSCAALLGFPLKIENVTDDSFKTLFPEGANFSGDDTIRSALDAIAEATQTIYYINSNWELTFKRLDKDGDAVFTINRNNYFEFYSRGNRTLGKIIHYTELGDNVESAEASNAVEGEIQYVRNNPFWSLREDIDTLVDNAQAAMSGLSIEQFECNWFGNYLLEIGDKINIVGKENKTFTTFLLNDSIAFDGSIDQATEWAYEENKAETATNPTSLGEVLNQTFARVDKANKQIQLVASEVDANSSAIATLQINTNSISASVKKIQTNTAEQLNSLENEIRAVQTEASSFKLESDNALLEFQTIIEENGVTKVDTGTGFSFSEDGLVISKTNSSINTTITEDGMSITRSKEEVLRADSQGVKAEDLHATTWLIIGNNSRLEDYTNERGESRTGCFWIGG